jgi:acyl-CoA synthetase (AMP-forming)/AMP-acid ligase II
MQGLMQARPLALPHIFHRAERHFAHKTITTTTATGEISTTYGQCAQRIRRLATALDALGLGPDEPGAELTEDQIIDFLRPRVARWWLPDEVRFIDAIPKTSTGKFSKKTLRERV